ncbi:MAG: uridine kinase [Bryobacterales bacterium]|nr:uridine kinase [Bryobacterales bacterium]MDE0625215.1 uridine kinase [Bryobacterales bacterium]
MIVVGIGGASGSGKTRVACELAAALRGSLVLSTDSYYLDQSGLDWAELAAFNFDDPGALDWKLMAAHLVDLKAGSGVGVPRYNFATHSRFAAPEWTAPAEILILEGLFALWEPRVRELVDLAVFLDAPLELCLARRIERDTSERDRTEKSVREQWRRDVAPMFVRHVLPTREFADMVVDGTAPPDRSAEAVLARLRRLRDPGQAGCR